MTSRGGRFSEVMTDKGVATHMHGERKKLRERKGKRRHRIFQERESRTRMTGRRGIKQRSVYISLGVYSRVNTSQMNTSALRLYILQRTVGPVEKYVIMFVREMSVLCRMVSDAADRQGTGANTRRERGCVYVCVCVFKEDKQQSLPRHFSLSAGLTLNRPGHWWATSCI